jgi:predicted transcriptional regulator
MKPADEVGELMNRPVISVRSVMQVFDALQVARDHGIHHLAVSDDDALCGIVCTCDLRDAALNIPVGNVMHRNVVTLDRHANVRQAAELMLERSVGSVLVTNGGSNPIGIVTRQDIRAMSPELSDLIAACRCAACGSMEHLRIARDGDYICTSCLERASPDGWFDLGAGD